MSENKRFWSEYYSAGYYTEIVDNDKELTNVPNPKKNLTIKEAVDLLNELNDECEFLETENEALEDAATKYAELCHKSLKENKLLKQQIKELKFKLRTIGTVKEDHSDAVYDFKKKLDMW